MKDSHTNKPAGVVYTIIWYVMVASLALIIVLHQSGIADPSSASIVFISHLYLALIPVALLILSIVLFVRRAHLSATISLLLFILWILLRFVIT